MSRVPFWQPGDAWQPPIIRIKGVDEKSLVGQRLLQAYEGQIKQFYFGQARAHALGIIDNSRGRKQSPDAMMTYTNMMGQEIVEVELRPEVVERVEDQIIEKPVPQYVFLEAAIPIVSAPTYASFIWRQIRGADGSLLIFPTPTAQPNTAVVVNNVSQWALDSPRVEVPALWSTGSRAVDEMVTRASCWFDLSDHARTGTIAKIQLYGAVEKSIDQDETLFDYVNIRPAVLGVIDGNRVAYEYYVSSGMDAIGFYLVTNSGATVRSFNEFFYHNPDLLGKNLALNTDGPGSFSVQVFTANGDGTVSVTYVGPGAWLSDPTGPPNYLGTAIKRELWAATDTFDGSTITLQLGGLVSDVHPQFGFQEEIPADVVISPIHPLVGYSGQRAESWFWAGITGDRIVIPTVHQLPVTPRNVYEGTVSTDYNGGDYLVDGLDYLGEYHIWLPERSVAFKPAS